MTGDFMELGLDLNSPQKYISSSMRFFDDNERHVTRTFGMDVLILVFKGVLKFCEDGENVEVSAGEYYIQRRNLFQEGRIPSERPEYYYIHFLGEWTDKTPGLKKRGNFSEYDILPDVKNLERACGGDMPSIVKTGIFYGILTKLFRVQPTSVAEAVSRDMAADMSEKLKEKITLKDFCLKYNYTKNSLIKMFKSFYGVTPMKYLQQLRINRAKILLEDSNATMENIALECGFSDYSHMYKAFIHTEKVPPNYYRKHNSP